MALWPSWGSYDFTPAVEEGELDSSDDSETDADSEPLKLYHRRKSTAITVKARVSSYVCGPGKVYKTALWWRKNTSVFSKNLPT